MNSLLKLFWKCVYTFNRNVLGRIPGVIIGNSSLYTYGDEYVKLRADGWIIVKSKKYKNSTDMLPVTLVSEDCIKVLIESSFFNADKILNKLN